MERAIVTTGLLRTITDDQHLYVVREEQDQHHTHDTMERQLDEWRDMIHRLRDAERSKRA
ncbi:MAG: hypothetical protein KDB95_00085 [Flavobacteriales bacterium]|nr:hypothetical protein [Flavobacteriales bacterium]